MSFAIGIDLGTTNSCAGVYNDTNNDVDIIYVGQEKQRILPSYVLYDKSEKEILVGKTAEKRLVAGKHPVVFEEVSAEILKRIKLDAEEHLNGKVTDAVITVPAYFTDSQRRATIKAAELAKLNVLELINEPTAAALAFAFEKEYTERLVLVYDLGGGTFDVSLVQFTAGEGRVIATNGHSNLGGRDFDNNLAQFLQKNKNLTFNQIAENKQKSRKLNNMLKSKCKKIKEELSETTEKLIDLDVLIGFMPNNNNGKNVDISVTRSEFESINLKLFEETIQIVDKTITEAKIDKAQIDDVLLVGGSTRIPKIRELLSKYFNGKELSHGINPDEAVALGAALKAAMLTGTYEGKIELTSMQDVTSYSLGIELDTKEMHVIIPKNTVYPKCVSKQYKTCVDFQTFINMAICYGEEKACEDNCKLGEFVISGAAPRPRGQVKVDVEFCIDSNSILTVTGTESSNQKSKSIQFNLKHS